MFLKMQPYKFRFLALRPNEKLSPSYYRPYEIVEKIGAIAYHLSPPPTVKIHSVLHVSQLKRHVGPTINIQQLPQCVADDGELELQPLEILRHRYFNRGELEILVRWKSLPDCENSWESFNSFCHLFPHFHLEDKVPLDGRGNVRTHIYISLKKRESKKEKTLGSWKRDQEAVALMQSQP